jgi:hypothetical protein
MPLDTEIVQLYADSKQAYEEACGDGHRPDDPSVLDARETYRANLAAYILDLEVNGMSVPANLTDEIAILDEA